MTSPTVSMLSLEDMPQEQLMAVAQEMLVNRRRSERVIYYRKPPRTPSGAPHPEAGWITWSDSQENKQVWLWAKGWVPLNKYGPIQAKASDNAPDGPFELYGPWGPILTHPDGPSEFPVSQILAFGWYDPKRCGVPGVKFPQLKQWLGEGNEIVEYACPECTDYSQPEARFLGRHLKNSHGWDRLEIIAYGKEVGFDLSREFTGRGKVRRTYTYDEDTALPELSRAEEEEQIAIRTVMPSQHTQRSTRKKAKGAPDNRTPEQIEADKRRMLLARQHIKPKNVHMGRVPTPTQP